MKLSNCTHLNIQYLLKVNLVLSHFYYCKGCAIQTEFCQTWWIWRNHLWCVSDNTNHDIPSLDGKDTHHGLGSIAIANGEFTSALFRRQKIPRDKRETWKDIKSNDGIKIIQYVAPNVPLLTKAIIKPLVQVSINILYSVS